MSISLSDIVIGKVDNWSDNYYFIALKHISFATNVGHIPVKSQTVLISMATKCCLHIEYKSIFLVGTA